LEQANTTRHTQRLVGIDLDKVRNCHVVDAGGALNPARRLHLGAGGRSRQQRAGHSLKAYSARNAAYDLPKLKGKNLVHRVKGSRRYKADPSGIRAMCAYLILRDKVIKPLLASVWPTAQSPSPGQSALRSAPRSSTEP
jgi:hypothetical protein